MRFCTLKLFVKTGLVRKNSIKGGEVREKRKKRKDRQKLFFLKKKSIAYIYYASYNLSNPSPFINIRRIKKKKKSWMMYV